MMKADVLSGIEKIKICTHYTLEGRKIDYLPFEDNANLVPVYKEIKGWEMNLMELDDMDNAPKELNNYISYLEQILEVPIKIVSVGPDRKQTFFV